MRTFQRKTFDEFFAFLPLLLRTWNWGISTETYFFEGHILSQFHMGDKSMNFRAQIGLELGAAVFQS